MFDIVMLLKIWHCNLIGRRSNIKCNKFPPRFKPVPIVLKFELELHCLTLRWLGITEFYANLWLEVGKYGAGKYPRHNKQPQKWTELTPNSFPLQYELLTPLGCEDRAGWSWYPKTAIQATDILDRDLLPRSGTHFVIFCSARANIRISNGEIDPKSVIQSWTVFL